MSVYRLTAPRRSGGQPKLYVSPYDSHRDNLDSNPSGFQRLIAFNCRVTSSLLKESRVASRIVLRSDQIITLAFELLPPETLRLAAAFIRYRLPLEHSPFERLQGILRLL